MMKNRHHPRRFSSGKNTKNLESNGWDIQVEKVQQNAETRCNNNVETRCNNNVETRCNNNVETRCTTSLHINFNIEFIIILLKLSIIGKIFVFLPMKLQILS